MQAPFPSIRPRVAKPLRNERARDSPYHRWFPVALTIAMCTIPLMMILLILTAQFIVTGLTPINCINQSSAEVLMRRNETTPVSDRYNLVYTLDILIPILFLCTGLLAIFSGFKQTYGSILSVLIFGLLSLFSLIYNIANFSYFFATVPSSIICNSTLSNGTVVEEKISLEQRSNFAVAIIALSAIAIPVALISTCTAAAFIKLGSRKKPSVRPKFIRAPYPPSSIYRGIGRF